VNKLPRIILIALILLIVAYAINRYLRLPAEKQKKLIKVLIISGVAVLMLILALSGRLNWLLAAVGALLPLLPRAAKMLFSLWPALLPYFRRYQQNKQTSMHTRFVKLQIDMLNGELQGEVLEGKFKGHKLQAMTLVQLTQLLDECKHEDAESAALLTAYLQRTHPEWEHAGDSADYSTADTGMSEQQARSILGVSENASKKEIIKAHKQIMQKIHPDKGGSDYLAQQVNQAKNTLMKLF